MKAARTVREGRNGDVHLPDAWVNATRWPSIPPGVFQVRVLVGELQAPRNMVPGRFFEFEEYLVMRKGLPGLFPKQSDALARLGTRKWRVQQGQREAYHQAQAE